MRIIADIESDGLLDTITKIHCLCYQGEDDSSSGSITDYQELIEFLQQPDLEIIGHNFIRFDKPALEKILSQKFNFKVIDTLPLSWVLSPKRDKHGLESYGEEFKIKKPEVKDWSNLSVEEYVHRCTEDVKINKRLWERQKTYLNYLYDDEKEMWRYCEYLSFKMDCVREQEEVGIKLNVPHVQQTFNQLTEDKTSKIVELTKAMPKNPIKKKKVYKDAIQDKNGNIYTKGDLFYAMANTEGQVEGDLVIETITGYEEPNPNSHSQIKNWLYSLGWEPSHIKHVRNKETNEVKKVPQIASKFVQGEVCESVKALFDKEPKLEVLNGLSVMSHRISIFEGFLKDVKGDRIYPSCSGLTNTLRLQHRVVVNLPGFDKKYGKEVRSSLIADDKLLCGSDLSGIEDNTKRHYIYKYDPKYVEEMSVPGYDPHLDIAVLAGFLTKEQADDHKLYDSTKGKEGKSYKAVRQKAKTTNFSATYKVGIPSLARNANITEKEAKKLLDIYWKRNEAILKVEKSLKVKTVFGQKWLLNPVSGFWYTLRAEKDRFSTLNQGTAVYVFDTWVKYIRQAGIKISLQMHDEWLANVNSEEETNFVILEAIKKVNEELKLNVTIACSMAYGSDYYQCH